MKVLALLSGLITALLALFIAPTPPTLGPRTTGDPALAERVRQAAGAKGYRGLSVAMIDDGRITHAGVGDGGGPDPRPVGPETAYELGSISKAMTGMLLADLAADGLSPDTPLRELLPRVKFSDPAVGAITLAELSSHRSGLPRLRMTPMTFARSYVATLTGGDPYGAQGPQAVLDDLAAVTISAQDRGTVRYSNLGAAVLGLALAEHAGTDYESLLRARILTPLGMDSTVVLAPQDPLPAGHAAGQDENGRPMDPWRDHGSAGAGGAVWSTSGDIAKLVKAVMDGTAPGAGAATPRFTERPDRRIGYGWFTTRHGERDITWHNGATGGFSTYAAFDRASGRGVVVMGNTSKPVQGIGLRLLGVGTHGGDEGPPVQSLAFALLFSFAGLGLLVSAFRNPTLDRLSVTGRFLWAVLFLWLAYGTGGWSFVPPFVWALGAGVLAAGAAAALTRWRAMPVSGGPLTWRSWPGPALPAVLLVAFGLATAL
ncbi:serine hydrolase domain-containing protein [Nonomuraea sp. NPDC049714]|uniref:serine hydrolase domain-containing protein n=1 Tax=Nonomuraea sp. NPDC049714 TaxID=3364357 RepID=UPI0037A20BAA